MRYAIVANAIVDAMPNIKSPHYIGLDRSFANTIMTPITKPVKQTFDISKKYVTSLSELLFFSICDCLCMEFCGPGGVRTLVQTRK